MSTVKVLLSGDPAGNLGALFKRVAAVNKANGPFDYLFCVGPFFPIAGASEDSAAPDAETIKFLTGKQEVPVPTFFIGAFGAGSRQAMAAAEASGTARLQWLGAAGVVRLKGLNVAFLDGLAAPRGQGNAGTDPTTLHGGRYNTKVHWDALTAAVERTEGDIDLLLTCDWPADVAAGLPSNAGPPDGAAAGGSEPLSAIAVAIRPRYHVCGGRGVFWARLPYMNKDLGAGSHATRFIALAAVGNAAKQKSLHALGMVPAAHMDASALNARPEGATGSPYEAAAASRKRSAAESRDEELGIQDWRWQDRKRARPPAAAPSLGRPGVTKDDSCSVYVRNLPFHGTEQDIEDHFSSAGEVVDVRRGTQPDGKLQGFGHVQFATEECVQRALQLHGSVLKGREIFVDAASNRPAPAPLPAGQPVDGCWFCLSNPNADVELVASVGEECYVAVDKGAINDGHVLVVPIEHFPNTLGISPKAHAEMDRYLTALASCYAAQGKEAVTFERFMAFRKSGGNHCHVNVVPAPAAHAARAREVFDKAAASIGAEFTELPKASGEAFRSYLKRAVGDDEYLRVGLPGGVQLVHPIRRGERFPINFGRDVASAIAGTPDRADWKKCSVDAAEETARTERFKASFKAHDIMQ
eukprot:CAMPEP_0206146064 /NCGR_PEP_ID=MMETSP1473-20131121/29358_1 /ASSEMBLY_ACC=CAM_ASM_001109 /TAXON_ID=1461547 /ORGANISM="Stichococcus sp, Strain RCC1054" /LENGTH=638 /DNA_ID=CAMNT_0053542501 /DNA_START=442 /DNA_END=2358 /DNA_ORIENTATION=+